ncbi:MAG: radical SAM protein [Planctomycetaceae bacterium]|nr:radical SAM protein [Planctomycetaceae bacterium]
MPKKLEIVYVVPSRYDDDGYAVRWRKGVVPSNSLAVLKALTQHVAPLTCYDDNVEAVPFRKIAARNRKPNVKVVVGIVGVQSNQFMRASDIALKFRSLGVDVLIGGFHVTGVLALFDQPSPELQLLLDKGVTLVAGESETPGVLEQVFDDARNDKLQPIYRFPKAPDISDAPLPQADPRYVDKFGARWATIDSSRGCPYGCTFCTVINIQGRKMRCRSAERVLETVKGNAAKGVDNFFFTDDNFARSAHWEAIFDGLIEMKENVGFMMQIDTQAAKIPHFIDKAKRAGCRMVFVGMESVNPENIAAAGKSQNHVDQYRDMVQTWQQAGVIVHVGYIIGFPNDTLESVRRDVVFLRDHVGVDLVSFFMMVPLPGSVDHKNMLERGEWIDPDLNKYDSFHETFKHPRMKEGEWKAAAQLAYSEFYTKEHCATILRRLPKEHYWLMFWNLIWYRYSGVLSGTHPMMTGFFRKKNRLDRRPGMPVENPFRFGWRWLKDFVLDSASYIKLFFEFQEIWFATRHKSTPHKAAVSTVKEGKQQTVWNSLAALQANWNTVQRQVAEYCWIGKYEDAKNELKAVLSATAQKLRHLAVPLAGGRKKREAERVAEQLESCVIELETAKAEPLTLFKAEQTVRETVLTRYEELASKGVRMRRKVNLWRRSMLSNLRKGRVVRCGLHSSRGLWLFWIDTYLSLRFSIAAMRKEL